MMDDGHRAIPSEEAEDDMEIRTKRIYDEPDEQDGWRVLVDRLWPRGMRKDRARIDLWAKDVAPSSDLRKWFGHDPGRFEEFSVRYREELERSEEAADFAQQVRQELDSRNVTLLYAARDEEHNHALVLKGWLERACDGKKGA
jgi:uncharacterized protein YeaO (DUF488 family)